jgi:hypothetical protein
MAYLLRLAEKRICLATSWSVKEINEKPFSLELDIFVSDLGDVGAKLEKLLQPGNGALVNGESARYSVFE